MPYMICGNLSGCPEKEAAIVGEPAPKTCISCPYAIFEDDYIKMMREIDWEDDYGPEE